MFLLCYAKSLQLCPTLCDLMDCSPSGSSAHGILQARILEQVAMPSSRGSSRSRAGTWVSCIGRQILYRLSHQGSPKPVQSILRCIIFSRFTVSRFYIYFTISDNMKLLLAFFFFSHLSISKTGMNLIIDGLLDLMT